MDNAKKELLISAGVDLTGALERFMDNETLYENYLRKFATNKNFTDLQTALDQEDWRNALEISHNLKGTAGSLGFTKLYELVCAQVTMLRKNENAEAAEIMAEIMTEYRRLLEVTNQVTA